TRRFCISISASNEAAKSLRHIASPYFIAKKENPFASMALNNNASRGPGHARRQHESDVGSGPSFVTATLEGAPAFVVVSSWISPQRPPAQTRLRSSIPAATYSRDEVL